MSFGDYVISPENIQNSFEEYVSRNHINNDTKSITSLKTASVTPIVQKCFCPSPSACSHSQQTNCLDDAHSHQLQHHQQQQQQQQQHHHQQFSCSTPLNYDSGNFTYNSNTSDSSLQPLTEDDEELDSEDSSHLMNRHKKSTSFPTTTGNEIRKLRSELTRTVKSEQWYKNELKLQKRMRLELLERLYLNEHKFIKENQTLKTECDRWQQIYNDLEQKFDEEKENFTRKLHELESRHVIENASNSTDSSTNSLIFELQKQKDQCKEYEIINNLLRKQKAALLNDLHALMNERDTKTASLEKKTLTLETENSQITQKCIRLVGENKNLHERISKAEELLTKARNDLQKNEIKLKKLKFDYDKKCAIENGNTKPQEQDTNSSECDVALLKNTKNGFISTNCQSNAEIFEECYPNSHNNDNFDILDLKTQISQLEQLRKADIEALNRTRSDLEIKTEEIQTLQSVFNKQTDHIQKLQEEISEYKKLRENLDKYVNLLETNNHELEVKQNEVEELKNVLKDNQLEIERYYRESLQLQGNVDELNKIHDQNLLKINEKSEEVQNLKGSLSKLKEEMSGVLLDRENFHKLQIELSSLLENEKALRMSEAKELKQIIKQQSEQIIQQKLELEKYQQKCDELWNQIQFERSEFVRQSLEIQKTDDEKCDEYVRNENNLDQEQVSELKTVVTEEKCSSTDTPACQSQMKSHRVAVNLQLVGNENLTSNNSEFDKHIHNIEMLRTMLAQKSEKMTILCEEQEKWEKLLEKLDGVQQASSKVNNLVKDAKKDDEAAESLKSQLAEYANLLKEKDINIAQKEKEIGKLKQNLTTKCKNIEKLQNDFENIKQIHAKQLKEIQEKYKKSEKSLKDELNAKLIEFEIFKPLLSEQEEKLKTSQREKIELQQQIKILKETIDKLEENMKNFENEKSELQKTIKRMQEDTHNVPEMRDIECQTEVNNEKSGNNDRDNNDVDIENFKIMKKVMESEQRKKIARYELHIRTLLMNIKSYKKNLEVLESRYNALSEKCKKLEAKNENKKEVQNEEEKNESRTENYLPKEKTGGREMEENERKEEKEEEDDGAHSELQKEENGMKTKQNESCEQSNRRKRELQNNLWEDEEEVEKIKQESQDKLQEAGVEKESGGEKQNLLEEEKENIAQSELQKKENIGEEKSVEENKVEVQRDLQDIEQREEKKGKQETLDRSQSQERSEEERESNKGGQNSQENGVKGNENLPQEETTDVEKLSKMETDCAGEKYKLRCKRCVKSGGKIRENMEKLKEFGKKYEESEKLVQTLKHQLETARNQFLELDDYKRDNQNLKMKLINFIDDYKKISQIASNHKKQNRNSNGPSYTDIIKLIEKSNNFVPNLDNVFSSLNDLKINIQQFKNLNAISGASCNTLLKRSPSLAEELRVAAEISKL